MELRKTGYNGGSWRTTVRESGKALKCSSFRLSIVHRANHMRHNHRGYIVVVPLPPIHRHLVVSVVLVVFQPLLESCIQLRDVWITDDTVGVADTGPSGLYTPAAIVITTSRPVSFLIVNIEVMGIAGPFHTAEEKRASDKTRRKPEPKAFIWSQPTRGHQHRRPWTCNGP
ncbi:hypothetical protein L484_017632 [Morus notabilis]|uniref:Uncharacterized protein n=1 Tax=Morus notabilis TaxID=981085 RepID=W9SGG5_9ROSA|nr:hypothetical protein L484_017632 [Morus notabilis]